MVTAKTNSSNCLLYKSAVTAVCFKSDLCPVTLRCIGGSAHQKQQMSIFGLLFHDAFLEPHSE